MCVCVVVIFFFRVVYIFKKFGAYGYVLKCCNGGGLFLCKYFICNHTCYLFSGNLPRDEERKINKSRLLRFTKLSEMKITGLIHSGE